MEITQIKRVSKNCYLIRQGPFYSCSMQRIACSFNASNWGEWYLWYVWELYSLLTNGLKSYWYLLVL